MRLIGDRVVLVELKKIEEKTEGGIFIPDNYRERESTASNVYHVLDMSKELKEEGTISVGDRVVAPRYFGSDVHLKGETRHLRILRRSDIWAILDDNEQGD